MDRFNHKFTLLKDYTCPQHFVVAELIALNRFVKL